MNPSAAALMAKSDKNWKIAEDLFTTGEVDAAANRFYYSLFQGIAAYGVPAGKISGKIGVHSQAGRLIKSFLKLKELYDAFETLEGLRTTADYDPDNVNKSDLQQVLQDSDKLRKCFLDKAKRL